MMINRDRQIPKRPDLRANAASSQAAELAVASAALCIDAADENSGIRPSTNVG